MTQLKTHDNCKYFGHQKCPHINDDIMKQATQETPEYHGGKHPEMQFPTDEEIDEICDKCDMFTKK